MKTFKIPSPFHSQDLISNSPYDLPYNSYDVRLENLVLTTCNNPLIDIFLYSHHLSASLSINNVRRYSVLVTDRN